MYPASSNFQQAIKSTRRVFALKLEIDTAFDTFNLTDKDVDMGTLKLNEGCAPGGSMEIGTAQAALFDVSLNNRDGRYDDVQFNGGVMKPIIGLELPNGNIEWVPLGVFNIDDVSRPTTSAPLGGSDNLILFDVAFAEVPISFPTTNKQILAAVCNHVGVPLATTSFLNDDYVVQKAPSGTPSCRDIVKCIAELAAGYAQCDRTTGALKIMQFQNPGCVQEANVDGGDFLGIDHTASGTTIEYDGPFGTKITSIAVTGKTTNGHGITKVTVNGTDYLTPKELLNGDSYDFITGQGTTAAKQPITGTPQRILTDGHTTITNDGGAQMQVGYNTMTGDNVDGGDFDHYNDKKTDGGAFVMPDPAVALGPDNRYDFKIDDNPVTITGIVYEADNQDYVIGDRTYALHISDNALIQGDPTEILNSIADVMIGFTYLPFTSSWQGNPALQPGDIIQQTDRNGVQYRTIVTNSSYAYRGVCNLSAKGASEIAHGFQSAQTKKATQLLRLIHEKQVKIDSLDQAILNATSLIAGALGSHWIDGDDLPDEKYHGNVFIADNPDITKAQKVWRWNLGGFGHSNTGVDGPYTTAITADDSIVANIITASMIKTGRLESISNPNVYFDLDEGVLCASKLVSSEDGYTDVYADVGLQGWNDGVNTKGVRLFTKDGSFLSLTTDSSSTSRSAVIHSPGSLTIAANASSRVPWGDGDLLTLENFGNGEHYIVASVANGMGVSIVRVPDSNLNQVTFQMPGAWGYTIDKDGWNGPIYGVYGRSGDILPGATIHVSHGVISGWSY